MISSLFQRPNFLRTCIARTLGFLGTMWLLVTQSVGHAANDPGLGWHLATGQWIATHHDVPQTEPFLFLTSSQPWIADQWLADVILYFIYSLGSFPLLCAALTALFLITYWGILFSFVTRHQNSLLTAMYSVIIATKVALIHFIVRPVPLSFLLFALTFITCINVYRSESATISARRRTLQFSAGLLLIFVAWTNIHPSFVMGLCVVASAAGFGVFENNSISPTSRKSISTVLLVGFCISSLATLFNPYGSHIFDALLSSAQWTDSTNEWKPTDFSQTEGRLLLTTLFTITLAYARYPEMRTRITRLEIFFVVVFGVASLHAVRMVPYFGIVAALPLAISWRELGREVFRKNSSASPPVASRQGSPGIGVICALSLVFFTHTYLTHSLLFFDSAPKRYDPSPSIFPTVALSHLTNLTPPNESQGILAEPDWGGAITWYGAGRLRATIDDRDILFRLQDYKDTLALLNQSSSDEVYEHMLQNRIKNLLVRTGSPVATRVAQDARFQLMYRDDTAMAFSIAGL